MKRRFVALFTALILVLSLLPVGAVSIGEVIEPITAVPEMPDVSSTDFVLPAADVTPQTAQESAAFLLKVIYADSQGDANNRTYSYDALIELSEPVEFYDCFGNVTQYLFTYTVKGDAGKNGYVLVSAHSDLPLITQLGEGDSPFRLKDGETMFYISSYYYYTKSADGIYRTRYGWIVDEAAVINSFADYADYRKWLINSDYDYVLDIQDANEALIAAANEAERQPNIRERLTAFFEYIIDFFTSYLQYALFNVYFDTEEPQGIPDELEAELLAFAGKNGCYLTESHFIDKENLVPHDQGYYAENEDIGDGICGVASWMMLLAYYRDGLGYTNIPDDETMYDDLMAIFDKITDKLSPLASLAEDICEIISEKTELSIAAPENSYEVIYALDAGIAQYLYALGYTELALNCAKNISFSIPLLTPAANALMLKNVRSEISDWLYEQTGGKLNVSLTLNRSARSVAESSLKRGEPIIIGNWMSLTSTRYTNHYFLGAGYCKLSYEYEYNGKIIYTAEKTLVEIYDTWGESHSAYVDWDVLRSTCLYDINSLASLG